MRPRQEHGILRRNSSHASSHGEWISLLAIIYLPDPFFQYGYPAAYGAYPAAAAPVAYGYPAAYAPAVAHAGYAPAVAHASYAPAVAHAAYAPAVAHAAYAPAVASYGYGYPAAAVGSYGYAPYGYPAATVGAAPVAYAQVRHEPFSLVLNKIDENLWRVCFGMWSRQRTHFSRAWYGILTLAVWQAASHY